MIGYSMGIKIIKMRKNLSATGLLFLFFGCFSVRAQLFKAEIKAKPVDTSFLLKVNGVDQYLEIKGVSRSNPVLLFIHGGPSWPINFFPYTNFKVPMYFFAGRYDYNTSSEVVEQYYNTINAPKKTLFWFEHSGHSPAWEEPELFYRRLLQIAGD
jgi:pimeloyl-ACP methyl ester carboxylesterase